MKLNIFLDLDNTLIHSIDVPKKKQEWMNKFKTYEYEKNTRFL